MAKYLLQTALVLLLCVLIAGSITFLSKIKGLEIKLNKLGDTIAQKEAAITLFKEALEENQENSRQAKKELSALKEKQELLQEGLSVANNQLIISNKILDVANKELNLATEQLSSFESIRQEIKKVNEELEKLTSKVEGG
jgi:chromosome segregation ATPase